jgi:hypothetical protein
MRERMRTFLSDEGIEGKSRSQSAARLIEQCVGRGAAHVEAQTVARWSVWRSPLQSLESWAQAPGLAGVQVPPELKQRVLTRLRTWAEVELGALDCPQLSEEEYIVEGVRLLPSEDKP